MKKIILSMAAVASMMLIACGNNADKKPADAVQDQVEVIEGGVIEVAETGAASAGSLVQSIKDSPTAANVQQGLDKVKQLMDEGKTDEAKSLLEQLRPYAEKVGLGSAVTSTENAVSKASEAVQAAGDKAADVKQQASDAVQAAKDKAADVKQQAGDAVQAAKDKAAAAKQQASDAADALKGLGK